MPSLVILVITGHVVDVVLLAEAVEINSFGGVHVDGAHFFLKEVANQDLADLLADVFLEVFMNGRNIIKFLLFLLNLNFVINLEILIRNDLHLLQFVRLILT